MTGVFGFYLVKFLSGSFESRALVVTGGVSLYVRAAICRGWFWVSGAGQREAGSQVSP